jgi:Arc/MetJ family transcription regulator
VVPVDGPRTAGAGEREDRVLIFKSVRDGRPYPEHGFSTRDWAMIPPRQIRLDTLVTTKRELALDALLADDSTFYGDLFPHAVQWHGEMYLEDGLHRALRAALQQRNVIHVRVLDLDALITTPAAGSPAEGNGGLDDTAAPWGSGSWGAARGRGTALDLDGPR